MMLRILLLLGTVALVSAKVKVTSLTPHPDSLIAQRTSFYKISGGFVARRGQPFEVIVEVDGDIDMEKATLSFYNDANSAADRVAFAVELKMMVDSRKYILSVSTSIVTPVGKYENIVLSVEQGGPQESYEYPFPLYIIFNPWNPEEDIFLPTETMRQEYVLNEYGNVYQGSLKDHDHNVWHYGHSNQVVLDAAFHLLKKLDRKLASDPMKVMQTLSANQGMIRNPKTGYLAVGSYDALLEGNWGFWPTDDSNEPTHWNSVAEILRRWKDTNQPAKYGQCWVFAALLNALMRSIGIGSRQISAFGAMVDASNKRDKQGKFHHVIDEYYDVQGNFIHREGMAWNFHSWAEVFLRREDTTMSGWNNLDGTPSGNGTTVGPAPTAAVKALREDYPYNVSFEISTVHATQRTFLVTCDENHTKGDKLDHCEVQRQVRYDPTGVNLIVSSTTLENGTLVLDDITSDFVDHSLDAFIPFEADMPRRMQAEATEDVAVAIKPATYNITIGDDITGVVEIDTSKFTQGELVQLNMVFTLETYQAVEIKKLLSVEERVLIKGRKVSIPWVLDSSSYLQKDVSDIFVKVVVTAATSDKRYFFDSDVFDIDAPSLEIVTTGTQTGSGSVPLKATFTNPFDFPLKDVCVNLNSYDLSFEDHSPDVTVLRKCVDLKARDTVEFQSSLVASTAHGSYRVLATVQGDYLPAASSHVQVRAGGDVPQSSGFALLAAGLLAVFALAVVVGSTIGFRRIRRRVDGAWPQVASNRQELTGAGDAA